MCTDTSWKTSVSTSKSFVWAVHTGFVIQLPHTFRGLGLPRYSHRFMADVTLGPLVPEIWGDVPSSTQRLPCLRHWLQTEAFLEFLTGVAEIFGRGWVGGIERGVRSKFLTSLRKCCTLMHFKHFLCLWHFSGPGQGWPVAKARQVLFRSADVVNRTHIGVKNRRHSRPVHISYRSTRYSAMWNSRRALAC